MTADPVMLFYMAWHWKMDINENVLSMWRQNNDKI